MAAFDAFLPLAEWALSTIYEIVGNGHSSIPDKPNRRAA